MVDRRKDCIKMLFSEIGKRVANRKIHGVKRTQPSVHFDSTNKYLI
jgi:hypothetical protein